MADYDRRDDRRRDDRDRRRDSPSRRRRSRSRSRSPRRGGGGYGDRYDPYERRDRDRDYRRGDRDFRGGRDRDRERDSGRRRKEEEIPLTPEEQARKEAEEQERDLKTVHVYNLHFRVTEKKLEDIFAAVGKVRGARLILDKNTGRSKGSGYVEFFDHQAAIQSLSLTGTIVENIPIMVKSSEAIKNIKPQSSTTTTATMGPIKVYVGNLHKDLEEEDLREIFTGVGELTDVKLEVDADTKESKGYGYVVFKKAEDAKKALATLNGLEVLEQPIKVGLVNEQGGDDASSLTAQTRQLLEQKLQQQKMIIPPPMIPGMIPLGAMNPALAHFNPALAQINPALLAGAGGLGPAPIQIVQTQTTIAESACVLLKNMFDPSKETEPEWELDIQEDVAEKAGEFGAVLHCHVDKNSQGLVYLKFDSRDAAKRAVMALNGKWFAGNQISAELYSELAYTALFPSTSR